jgi:hypothetical protein
VLLLDCAEAPVPGALKSKSVARLEPVRYTKFAHNPQGRFRCSCGRPGWGGSPNSPDVSCSLLIMRRAGLREGCPIWSAK